LKQEFVERQTLKEVGTFPGWCLDHNVCFQQIDEGMSEQEA
jgi:hypothetical protein